MILFARQSLKIAAKAKRWPKSLKDLRRIWDETCEHVSDHVIQGAVKRAHSVDAEGNPRLGNPLMIHGLVFGEILCFPQN